MLEGMGFPLIRCQKALQATGNSDGEAAMEWLFAHMDDPGVFGPHFQCIGSSNEFFSLTTDIDDPIQLQPTSTTSGHEPSPEAISMIADMGFTSAQARKALKETVRHPVSRSVDIFLF